MELVTDSEESTEEMNGGCCCGYPYLPVDCTPPSGDLMAILF